MKILHPKEYKRQNPQSTLKDYIEYIQDLIKDIQTVLDGITDFSLQDDLISEFKNNLTEFFKIITAVHTYLHNSIIELIENMTLDELQSYFADILKNIEELEKEKQHAIDEKNLKLRELSSIDKTSTDIRIDNLDKNDLKVFFMDFKDFLKDILQHYDDASISKLFKESIRNESVDDQQVLQRQFSNYFNKIKKIIRLTKKPIDQVLEELTSKISSKGKYLLANNFNSNSFIYILKKMMMSKKFNTDFFKSLPTEIQERLKSDLFEEEYNRLKMLFENPRSEERVVEDSNPNKKEIADEIKSIDSKISSYEYRINTLKASYYDSNNLRERLRSYLRTTVYSSISLDTLDFAISSAKNSIEMATREILDAMKLLSKKKANLKTAQIMLITGAYESTFERVRKQKETEVLTSYGVNPYSDNLKPFLETEKRRLRQFQLLVNFQEDLKEIYYKAQDLKKKFPFFMIEYTRTYKSLIKSYQQSVKDFMEFLFKEGLHIIIPPVVKLGSDTSATRIEVIDTTNRKIEYRYLDEYQEFMFFENTISEEVQNEVLKKYGYDSWSLFAQSTIDNIHHQLKLLFTFEENKDFPYQSKSHSYQKSLLTTLQERVIDILEREIEYREKCKKRDSVSLDPNIIREIDSLLGYPNAHSKEDLIRFIYFTENEIEALTKFLTSHSCECEILGISLPKDIDNSNVEQVVRNFHEPIDMLALNNIHTLNDAMFLRSIIYEFNCYIIGSEELKNFIIQKLPDKPSN